MLLLSQFISILTTCAILGFNERERETGRKEREGERETEGEKKGQREWEEEKKRERKREIFGRKIEK